MADPPSTRLHIDPPIDQWRVTPRSGRTKPIIATGHQPTLWHPGIFAKYLAADAFAKHVGGNTLNVVVEHNPVQSTGIDLPAERDQALQVTRLTLDDRSAAATTPPNRLAPLNAADVVGRLARQAGAAEVTPLVREGLYRLAQAYQSTGPHEHLVAQASAVLDRVMHPFLHQPMQALPTSTLVTPRFLARLLQDPVGCVRSYNHAAQTYPEAGIRPLYLGRDVVEVPLWAQDKAACTPVFADLGDSQRPQLFTTAHNRHLDLAATDALQHLRPRAITLSAIMRSELCDLFIHGTGGGVYDQVTERWWQDWVGEDLAPRAVVSADAYLPFNVPVASPEEHAKAQWYAHHLPHNIDRYADVDQTLRREKRELLDHMNDDRDRRRRSSAFQRIHAINNELAEMHKALIAQTRQDAEAARVGIGNGAIARRRDWCFALYPEAVLQGLADQISSRLTPSP